MKLSSLIDPRHALTGERVKSVDEAVQRSLKLTENHYAQAADYGRALAAVRERIAIGGTVLPTGVAIPHARLPGFDDLLVAPVTLREPLPVEEGRSVRLVWVVLLGTGSAGLYLKILAAVARIAGDEALTAALVAAADGREFVEILERSGIEVDKDAHVEDVMSSPVVGIREDATVKELLDLMASRSLRYVPVLDAEGRLAGEVGVLDVIDASIPDYARRVGKLMFLDELGPMEDFLRRESEIRVREIMKKPAGVFARGDSLVAVALAMTKQRKRHFPVCEGDTVVGVLSSMDILFKVLRA